MVEEKGIVNKNLEAVMQMRLTNGASVNCVIDTGFAGSLLLPREFVEKNSMISLGPEEVTMVEEFSTEIDTALAKLDWLGEEVSLRIFVSETNDALIGVEMFADSVLEIDYKNLTVKITK